MLTIDSRWWVYKWVFTGQFFQFFCTLGNIYAEMWKNRFIYLCGCYTNDHNLGAWNNRNLFSQFWRPKVQYQGASSKGSRTGSFLPLPGPGGPRHSLAYGCTASISACLHVASFSCCVFSSHVSFKDTWQWIGVPPVKSRMLFSWDP